MIVTFTGASGAGKSSIVAALLEDERFHLVRSTTTRKYLPRDHPDEYRYVSLKDFERWETNGLFLWTTPPGQVHGNRYGTLKTDIDRTLADSDRHGVMFLVPDVLPRLLEYVGPDRLLSFYVLSPGEDELRRRLAHRGDEPQDIEGRIADCRDWDEKAGVSEFPYLFVRNDSVIEVAVQEVLGAMAYWRDL